MAKLCIYGAENVFLADEAAIEQGEAGPGHQQHQGSRYQHPGVVAGGLGALDCLLKGGNLSLCVRRRAGWLGESQRRTGQRNRQKQQLDSTTTHDVFAPKKRVRG